MLVTTVKQQILIGRAARAAGGYSNLAKEIAKRRAMQEHKKAKSPIVNDVLAVKAGEKLIPVSEINSVDITKLEQEVVIVNHKNGEQYEARGFDAIEVVMVLKPSAVEGRRLKWNKNAWAFHNFIGHPIVQILAWFGFKKQAVKFHDWTTPTPRGFKNV